MFADARKKDGSHYKLSALKGIRFGLARHFQKEMDIDIIKYDLFKKANEIFKAFKVQLKRKGLGYVEHSPSLDEDDIQQYMEVSPWISVHHAACRIRCGST